MIFGDYPCCGGTLSLSMPQKTPAVLPEKCPHCNAKVWHYLSRIETVSYTDDEFLKRYDVDSKTKAITEKKQMEAK